MSRTNRKRRQRALRHDNALLQRAPAAPVWLVTKPTPEMVVHQIEVLGEIEHDRKLIAELHAARRRVVRSYDGDVMGYAWDLDYVKYTTAITQASARIRAKRTYLRTLRTLPPS